jgi:DNA primase
VSFPPEFLDEVRRRVSLGSLISRQVRLVRRGHEFVGCCPFHKEKTPSFTVNEEKGFYHCFGCGAHGSLFDFIMQTENVTFPEAVERLASDAGLPLPQVSATRRDPNDPRKALRDVLEAATMAYQKALREPSGRPALDYLGRRGVKEEAIVRFRLGYAPADRQGLAALLGTTGPPDQHLIDAGLVIKPEDGGRPAYDRFRGRIMFPITDVRGRVIAFGGRLLGPGEPKYLNSPETPVFHKGETLYGLAQALKPARTTGTILVVEGYLDVISLATAGYAHVVAPLGTALTEAQLKKLWEIAANPILCFDPDAAGQRAALRALDRALPLLRSGLGLKFAFLATDTADDPDGMVRRYPDRLFIDHVVTSALSLSDLMLRSEAGETRLDDGEAVAGLLQRLRSRIETISDPALRREMERSFRDRLRRPIADRGRSKTPFSGSDRRAMDARAGGTVTAPPIRPSADAEKTLLAILINHPRFFASVEDAIGATSFADGDLDRLRQALVACLSGERDLDRDGLLQGLDEQGLGAQARALLTDPLIRVHRMIQPRSDRTDVRAAWDENFNFLRSRIPGTVTQGSEAADLSDADLEQRLAQKRASLKLKDD